MSAINENKTSLHGRSGFLNPIVEQRADTKLKGSK